MVASSFYFQFLSADFNSSARFPILAPAGVVAQRPTPSTQHGSLLRFHTLYHLNTYASEEKRLNFARQSLQKNLRKETLVNLRLGGPQINNRPRSPEEGKSSSFLQPWRPTTECQCIRLFLQYKEALEMSTQLPSSQHKFRRLLY